MISFLNYYPKLKPCLVALKQTTGVEFATLEELRKFCQNLAEITSKYSMEICNCFEELDANCGIRLGRI